MSVSNKNATLSLRINLELKDKLHRIAKEKDTSLNDMSSQIFAEFVENYELEQVKNDEIPTKDEALKMQEDALKNLLANSLNLVHSAIAELIKGEYVVASIDAFKIPYTIRDQISEKLTQLGYFFHFLEFDIDTLDPHNGEGFCYKSGTLVISLHSKYIKNIKKNDFDPSNSFY